MSRSLEVVEPRPVARRAQRSYELAQSPTRSLELLRTTSRLRVYEQAQARAQRGTEPMTVID